ncbi:unnamed protein product [Lactuca virosa]|uniref:Germin-like protein n=1 Tax=Lactuca virosa TaxID=75947 RepID=A0AAU9P3D6_9ASTR|nr:unnamed protein product [Lactuca virosa]
MLHTLFHIFLYSCQSLSKSSFLLSVMRFNMVLLGLMVMSCSLALASDPSPLQDFCVAEPNTPVLVNGLACKDAKLVQADDFLFRGIHLMGNTSTDVGSKVTPVSVAELPGLNTLGNIQVGFVTSNPENRLITKVIGKGDIFVFPIGLIHFQRNVGNGYAVALASLSSQNPGVITIGNAVFGSNPDVDGDLLAKAFHVDKNVIFQIQSKF